MHMLSMMSQDQIACSRDSTIDDEDNLYLLFADSLHVAAVIVPGN